MRWCLLCLLIFSPGWLMAQDTGFDTTRGDQLLADYFERETSKIEASCLADIKTLEDWESRKEMYRDQLREMLGLDPWPERTPLNAEVVRILEHDDFVVEMLHYQSSPGLYVTANLYRPKVVEGKLPAVLYVCGHARVNDNGVSYGNKVGYHHHGCWFARNGYLCLMIDTIQLGEIEGLHHGTYREGMWWWASRGYTPAGVEAWNGIRGLDYLESRQEVDASRMGVTGRSGGGAYSWWVAALDERVQCAVPVAGITSMRNHIVDNCIEGHCDCMFQVNTYQWDFPLVAALVAPRPLLIANTDKDTIFPLDGVVDVHRKVKRIYDLYGKPGQLGLNITEGPHKDTQELRTHAFVWFNRFLKGSEADIAMPAVKMFQPPDLKVFEELPQDERVTTAHDWFVPGVTAAHLPKSPEEFEGAAEVWHMHMQEKCLRAWPAQDVALAVEKTFSESKNGILAEVHEFGGQAPYRLTFSSRRAAATSDTAPSEIVVHIANDSTWRLAMNVYRTQFPDWPLPVEPASETEANQIQQIGDRITGEAERLGSRVFVDLAIRGIGPTEWNRDPRERAHIERRFLLLGESIEAQRAWDILQGLRAVRETYGDAPISLVVHPGMEVAGLVAACERPHLQAVNLLSPKTSLQQTHSLLNSLKSFDIPQLILWTHSRVGRMTILSSPGDDALWEQLLAANEACGFDPETLRVLRPAPDSQ